MTVPHVAAHAAIYSPDRYLDNILHYWGGGGFGQQISPHPPGDGSAFTLSQNKEILLYLINS